MLGECVTGAFYGCMGSVLKELVTGVCCGNVIHKHVRRACCAGACYRCMGSVLQGNVAGACYRSVLREEAQGQG